MKPLTFTRGAALGVRSSHSCTRLRSGARRRRWRPSAHSDDSENARGCTCSRTPLPHTSSGSFGGTVVRTIVGLLIVIAVIYGLSWVLKQAKGNRNPSTGDGTCPDRVAAARPEPIGGAGPRRRGAAPAGRRRARRHQHPRVQRGGGLRARAPVRSRGFRYVRPRWWTAATYNAWSSRCGGSRSGRTVIAE